MIVPKEPAFAYVWDTGDQKGAEAGELGKLEDDFEDDEMRMYRDVFRQKIESGCFVHRSKTYGYLMSATAPILGADGRPVALTCVDVPMDDVDSQVDRVVLSIALVTLAIVLLCLAGFYLFVSRYIVSPAERQIQSAETAPALPHDQHDSGWHPRALAPAAIRQPTSASHRPEFPTDES